MNNLNRYGTLYTKEDQFKIVQFIIKKQAFLNLRGKKIWRQLIAEGVLKDRTAEAVRAHFSKVLIHKIRFMSIEEKHKSLILKGWESSTLSYNKCSTLISLQQKLRNEIMVGGESSSECPLGPGITLKDRSDRQSSVQAWVNSTSARNVANPTTNNELDQIFHMDQDVDIIHCICNNQTANHPRLLELLQKNTPSLKDITLSLLKERLQYILDNFETMHLSEHTKKELRLYSDNHLDAINCSEDESDSTIVLDSVGHNSSRSTIILQSPVIEVKTEEE